MQSETPDTDFVKFWNSVLEPKFTKYRHILQGGLSRHSAAVLPPIADQGKGWQYWMSAAVGATCRFRWLNASGPPGVLSASTA